MLIMKPASEVVATTPRVSELLNRVFLHPIGRGDLSLGSHVSIKTATTTGCVILFYTLLHGSKRRQTIYGARDGDRSRHSLRIPSIRSLTNQRELRQRRRHISANATCRF
jgi:hypothetical protein